MERRFAGPRVIMILSLMSGTIDLTANGWGHQVKIKLLIANMLISLACILKNKNKNKKNIRR